MIELILDTLVDLIRLIPFLFVAFLIIELLEHKFNTKVKKVIASSEHFGPLLGGVLGGIPQCGFSVVATNLYITKIITLGTLISIYLSTSDEMIPILISHNFPIYKILTIVGIKIIIGIICGFIIDFVFRKKVNTDFHICEESHCECQTSLLKSTIIHTMKTSAFILVISFLINIAIFYIPEYLTTNIFIKNDLLSPFIASLIGLIPNCGASITLTELYVSNIISFGTVMSGLLTNSGVAILVLFKSNKKRIDSLKVLLIVYSIGVIIGLLLNIFSISI